LDECPAEDPTRSCGLGTDNMTMILVVFESTAPQAHRRSFRSPRRSLFSPCGSGGPGPATPCACVPKSQVLKAAASNQQGKPASHGCHGGSKPASPSGCTGSPTVGQRAQVWRSNGSWSPCHVQAILPDGSVKVVIEGKDELKKVLTQAEISSGFLKLRKEVGDSAPVPCLDFF